VGGRARRVRQILTFVAIAIVLLFMVACSADFQESAATADTAPIPPSSDYWSVEMNRAVGLADEPIMMFEFDYAAESEMWFEDDIAGTAAGQEYRPEVILKSAFVELSSENFSSDKTHLETLTRQMGGFIESSNIFNENAHRRFHVVLRVPAENFSELKAQIEETGRLISSSESIQNVTGEYYDVLGRLEIKRIEEERILDMIENAQSVETILVLEEQLGRVRTDIEIMQSWINDVDSLAAFSTITVDVTEVLVAGLFEGTGNFGQRLWYSFVASVGGTATFFGNVIVFLAGAVVPLTLIAVLVFTGLYVGKKLNVFRGHDRAN
jgi:hypothetical protein